MNFAILVILSLWFGDINYIHNVMQQIPLSVFKTFHHTKQFLSY